MSYNHILSCHFDSEVNNPLFLEISDFQLLSLENENVVKLYNLSRDKSKITTLAEKNEIVLHDPLATAIENDKSLSDNLSIATLHGKSSYLDLPFPLPISSNIKLPFTLDFLSLERIKRESKNFPWYYHFCEKGKIRYGDFFLELPMEPDSNIKSSKGYINNQFMSTLMEAFGKRPIWSRFALQSHLNCNVGDLEKHLPFLAFFYIDGPWHNCWVRYGVDPRNGSEYAKYQTIQVRNSLSLAVQKLIIKDKSIINSHVFDGVKFPGTILFFQICDITFEPLKALIGKACSSKLLNLKSGWFSSSIIYKLRNKLKEKWLELLKDNHPKIWSVYSLDALKKDNSHQTFEFYDE